MGMPDLRVSQNRRARRAVSIAVGCPVRHSRRARFRRRVGRILSRGRNSRADRRLRMSQPVSDLRQHSGTGLSRQCEGAERLSVFVLLSRFEDPSHRGHRPRSTYIVHFDVRSRFARSPVDNRPPLPRRARCGRYFPQRNRLYWQLAQRRQPLHRRPGLSPVLSSLKIFRGNR